MTDLLASARRALEALDDLISNTSDPGVEALGARSQLATALINQNSTTEAALERVRIWIEGEPVTARSEFGSGYREALRDIGDVIEGRPTP